MKAAPIVKRFEGQTIGALTSWARRRFGEPIIVEKLNQEGNQSHPGNLNIPSKTRF